MQVKYLPPFYHIGRKPSMFSYDFLMISLRFAYLTRRKDAAPIGIRRLFFYPSVRRTYILQASSFHSIHFYFVIPIALGLQPSGIGQW